MNIEKILKFIGIQKKESKKEIAKDLVWRWGHVFVLMIIVVAAFWLRSLPARFGELQALDPLYMYRMSEYALQNNLRLPEVDYMRHHPFGAYPIVQDNPGPLYIPLFLYLVLSALGMSMGYLDFAILSPAIFGAIAVLVMYFLGKEILDRKTGLLAAFFLAVIPGFITRTSSGFFEKEPLAAIFINLTVLFFIMAYKRNSWKYGILDGLAILLLIQTWGGVSYFLLLFSLFVVIMLFLNRISEGLIKAYVPFFLFPFLFIHLFPYNPLALTSPISLLTITIFGAFLIRYLAEKFKVVKKEQLPYLMPALLVAAFLVVIIGSMFIDLFSDMINGLIGAIFIQSSVAGSTVAEQAPGSWNDVVVQTSPMFSQAILPQFSGIYPAFNLWIYYILGLFFLMYMVYKKRDWIYIFPILWLITSVWGVLGYIRLIFLVGPPAALMAGLVISAVINKLLESKLYENAKNMSAKHIKQWGAYINYVTVPILVFIIIMVALHTASGYIYSMSIGPSICFPQLLGANEKCLETVDGQVKLSSNQPWYQMMDFMRTQTPEDSNFLSWWDFGYWIQTRAERPTVSDGGGVGPRYDIAIWFVDDPKNWDNYVPWLKDKYGVDYIWMDYTLPGKYGAISKIAYEGEKVIGYLQFDNRPSNTYPKENSTIYEYAAGGYLIWINVREDGALVENPRFIITEGEKIVGTSYINDLCTPSGINNLEKKTPSIPGCLYIGPLGVFYVPQEAENTIFNYLMFMNGAGLPVEKVFDNGYTHIYKVNYGNETTSEIMSSTEEAQ